MKKPKDDPLWPVFVEWAEFTERYKGGEIFGKHDWTPWWFCFLAGVSVGERAGPIPFPNAEPGVAETST